MGPYIPDLDMLSTEEDRLVFQYDSEIVWIEPWGPNALRVRATKDRGFPNENWALQIPPQSSEPDISVTQSEGTITNGSIRATVSARGKIYMYGKDNQLILEEYARHRLDLQDPKCSALNIAAREWKAVPGRDSYHLTLRLESVDPEERLYGMGQYQQPYLNLKGTDLELAQRNSQCSVPFVLSSLGYGMLWNNPSIGRAVLGKNTMSWEALSTTVLDYWIVAGGTPKEIEEGYAKLTGTVPMMPEYGLGFWQCKLRYQTQEELLEVAREYKRRDLKVDVIVCDFFHWPKQGEWKFDPTYWPDPDAMIKELKDMGMELVVSIWPTVDKESENFDEMLEKGLLVSNDRGMQISMEGQGNPVHFDSTNPKSREFVWSKAKQNYYDKGVKVFWLDEAEPEYTVYDFDIYRYHRGSNLAIGNIYPVEYARAFHEGMTAAGQTNIVNLLRCAWAGSQKFGALVWSGDIASSWSTFRNQIACGMNMGIAGIPWWTTDIGGFHGGDPNDEGFRELFVRWFQWGAFCPVMRLHGDREPKQPQHGTTGGAFCCSGAPNEVWSYGEAVYDICVKYMNLREELREYTRGLMKEAHEKGSPVMRPLFYEFPQDVECWRVETQYMYGEKYLCCPVLKAGERNSRVYLPKGSKWKSGKGGTDFDGGQWIQADAPIEYMPVFVRQ